MPFVLDASVSLSWFFEDEDSDFARRVLRRLITDTALVPSLWPIEVANVLVVAERRGRAGTAQVAAAIALSKNLPISVQDADSELVFGAVLDLARLQGLSANDAAYLDLAMREGLPLATQDAAMRTAAEAVGVPLVE